MNKYIKDMNSFVNEVQNLQLEKTQRKLESVQSSSELNLLQFSILQRFDKAVIMSLMNDHADINYTTAYGLSALHLALESKDEDVVRQLLTRGANPNIHEQCNMLPLHVAAERLRQAVEGIRGDDYSTPLVFEMWIREVSDLMRRYYVIHCDDASEVNAKWRAPSALQFALDLKCPKLVELLLDHGARVDEANGECINILHTALMNSDDDTACLLIERGENLNSRDKRDRSPLHLAFEYKCCKAANLLISRGADVNAFSREMYTVMYWAVQNRRGKVVLRLLKAGASVRIPQLSQAEWKTLEVAVCLKRRGKKSLRLLKILLHRVFQHETSSELERREIATYLVKLISANDCLRSRLIIRCLAIFDLGIQHEFFERTNTAFIEHYYRQCVVELVNMKETILYGSLTLYELLARNGINRVSLVRNQVFTDKLKSCCYEAKFPIYERMLAKYVNDANTFKICYLYVEKIFVENFNRLPISHALPITAILDSMSKDDLYETYFRFERVCTQSKLMKKL